MRPLPGKNWEPPKTLFDSVLAKKYADRQMNELDRLIYGTCVRLSTKSSHQEIIEVRAEAFQQVRLDIAQSQEWLTMTTDEQRAFVISRATTATNAAIRIRHFQLMTDANATKDGFVGLKVGGKYNRPKRRGKDADEPSASDDTPDGESLRNHGGFHVSYRPDWIKCHAEESAIIDRIENPRVEEVETTFETYVRKLGYKNADWLWGYEWQQQDTNQRSRVATTGGERARACRLRQKLNGTVTTHAIREGAKTSSGPPDLLVQHIPKTFRQVISGIFETQPNYRH